MARRRAKFEIESMGLDHTKTYTLSELKKSEQTLVQTESVAPQLTTQDSIIELVPVITVVEQPVQVAISIEQEEQKPAEKKQPKQKKVKGDVLQAV